MNAKSYTIAVCISTVILLGFMIWEYFDGNFFGLSITALTFVIYYPAHIYVIFSKHRAEKALVLAEKRKEEISKEAEVFVRNMIESLKKQNHHDE